MLFQFIKKDDKQNVKNYRPVGLLPIYGKIFELLIYDVMYDFLTENDPFLQASQDLDPVTLTSINSFLLIMRFQMHLIRDLKIERYILIFQRLLTRYGMMVLFLNCIKIV